MPKITVLMCVYSGEKYLREAIDSILNQTFEDFEFLIINDASTDSSRDIILSYKDSRIRLIDNEENLGLTKSLNKGLKLARGEYVARMDVDDISLPQRLEKQFKYISKRPDVGLVSCWYDIVDENGKEITKGSKISFTYEDIYYRLSFDNCLGHSAVLFNKKLVLELGGYNELYKMSQDYELWYRISRVARIEQINEILVKWRNIKSNISFALKEEQEFHAQEIFIKNIESILSRKIKAPKKWFLCLHNYNFLLNMDRKDIRKTINTLNEINEKIIKNIPPNSNIDIKRVKKNAFNKTWMYVAYSIQQRKFSDAFMSLKNYPDKIGFFVFLPNKLMNKLRNVLVSRYAQGFWNYTYLII